MNVDAEKAEKTVCQHCGATLEPGQAFCTSCGKALESEGNQCLPATCPKCGQPIQDGHRFCPSCGASLGFDMPQRNNAIDEYNSGVQKRKSNKNTAVIVGAVAVLICVAVGFFMMQKSAVKEITLNETSIELRVDETKTVKYTITPAEASEKGVKWASSNETVATVNEEGKITAKGEGSCEITASAGSKSDSVLVTVVAGPDFKKIYDELCKSSWATLASDGSYLRIDTNPYDREDYIDYEAYATIIAINGLLELPESLSEKMGETRALDGRQEQRYENVTVSWAYHPDSGLEVMYEAN